MTVPLVYDSPPLRCRNRKEWAQENDGLGRAGGLACRLNLAVVHLAVFFFRVDLGPVHALHAVRALLHHAPAAHAHVRIALQLQALGMEIRKQEKVEPPHLVRAVIGAVARAYTAVVHHIVQAFAVVIGSLHGTHQFARRIFALHARHRLVEDLRIFDARLRSSGRRASSASRGRDALLSCPPPRYCFPPGRRSRTRRIRCRR